MGILAQEFHDTFDKYTGRKIDPKGGLDKNMKELRKLARKFNLEVEYMTYEEMGFDWDKIRQKTDKLIIIADLDQYNHDDNDQDSVYIYEIINGNNDVYYTP